MSSPAPTRPAGVLSTARVETLTDGVFAIVMTLLILEIHVPEIAEGLVDAELPAKLAELGPKLFSYALSFVILGVLWVGHHNQFYFIKRADRSLLWINILFLMFVAFIPFSAALLGEYGRNQLSVVIYGANLIVAGLILYLHWWYGMKTHHLTDAHIEPTLMRTISRRILTPPAIYLLAIALSFVSTTLSIILYIFVPLSYILPGRMDRVWVRRHEHPAQEADNEETAGA